MAVGGVVAACGSSDDETSEEIGTSNGGADSSTNANSDGSASATDGGLVSDDASNDSGVDGSSNALVDAAVDAAVDAGVDGSVDAGVTCLPSLCLSPSKPATMICNDFDGLDGGVPALFTGGPTGGSVPGRAMCGDAVSFSPSAANVGLALAAGPRDHVEFDMYVEKNQTPGGPVTFGYIVGPGSNGLTIQLALEAVAANAVGFKVRNIAGVPEGGSLSFITGTWAHATIDLTETAIALRVNGSAPLSVALPVSDSGTSSPSLTFSGAGSFITKLYIDNLVVDTNPM